MEGKRAGTRHDEPSDLSARTGAVGFEEVARKRHSCVIVYIAQLYDPGKVKLVLVDVLCVSVRPPYRITSNRKSGARMRERAIAIGAGLLGGFPAYGAECRIWRLACVIQYTLSNAIGVGTFKER